MSYVTQVDYYKSVYAAGTNLHIKTIKEIFPLNENVSGTHYFYDTDAEQTNGSITVTGPSGTATFNGYKNNNIIYNLEASGTYSIEYRFSTGYISGNVTNTTSENWRFTFNVVENENPLKLLTITNVINRLLDVAEPIRKGQKPRFRLRGMNSDGRTYQPNTPAAKYDKILAPQFSFTKQTLRECLQQVGQVIHGEPRIIPVKDNAYSEYGGYYYEVYFEEYGGQEISGIATRGYTQKQVSQQIAQYFFVILFIFVN